LPRKIRGHVVEVNWVVTKSVWFYSDTKTIIILWKNHVVVVNDEPQIVDSVFECNEYDRIVLRHIASIIMVEKPSGFDCTTVMDVS
jgi:hypothetical protein